MDIPGRNMIQAIIHTSMPLVRTPSWVSHCRTSSACITNWIATDALMLLQAMWPEPA
jgi:hypothetical protein